MCSTNRSSPLPDNSREEAPQGPAACSGLACFSLVVSRGYARFHFSAQQLKKAPLGAGVLSSVEGPGEPGRVPLLLTSPRTPWAMTEPMNSHSCEELPLFPRNIWRRSRLAKECSNKIRTPLRVNVGTTEPTTTLSSTAHTSISSGEVPGPTPALQ